MDGGKRCFHVEGNVRLQCFRSQKRKPSSALAWEAIVSTLNGLESQEF